MHPEEPPAETGRCILLLRINSLAEPGTSGVMIFDSALYKLKVPDNPGGGTVD